VQLPNGGWRAEIGECRELFDLAGTFQKSVLAFTRSMMLQISQTALCNRLHNIDERLSRWLLMCHDRFDGDVLPLTQEFLSIMLGANRTTVTQSAIDLQTKGFVEYRRGRITMTDRKGLEKFTCECYGTVAKAADRRN
jgi:CRP-like cAMP-binding protein